MFESIKIALSERYRQTNKEGFHEDHDLNAHEAYDLAEAAACYLMAHKGRLRDSFPFEDKFDKREKHSEFKCLVIGATLALAEIDRYINETKQQGINDEEMLGMLDDADALWNSEIMNAVRKHARERGRETHIEAREKGTRKRMIRNIEKTFPPDNHPDGHDVLMLALAASWRSLPDEVLTELEKVCKNKANFQERLGA